MTEVQTRASVELHPAAVAWVASQPGRTPPASIVVLQEGSKTGVYRLGGLPGTGSIVAQRMRRRRWQLERALYERVFPALPASTLRCYGVFEGGDDDCWLFVEDAGEDRLSFTVPEHRDLAVDWLRLLHTAGTKAAASVLPVIDPSDYLLRARAVRQAIGTVPKRAAGTEPSMTALVATLDAALDVLEQHWTDLARACATLPPTIVHGDFQEKNLRVRRGPAGLVLLPFDWANAGFGPPVVDLGGRLFRNRESAEGPGTHQYWSIARQAWPGLTKDAFLECVFTGRVFRLIVMIEWECRRGGKPETLGTYTSSLARRLRERRWLA